MHNTIPLNDMQNLANVQPNVTLWYQTFGDKTHPPIVLLMGSGAQAISWHDAFCERLAKQQRYVVRFDYRDTGFSTHFDFSKDPYNFFDMVNDVLGLLKVLNLEKAHFVGFSMGGFLTQLLGIYFPERVLSITVLMSTANYEILLNALQNIPTASHNPASKDTVSQLPPPKAEYIEDLKKIDPNLPEVEKQVAARKLENGEQVSFDEKLWHNLMTLGLKRVKFKQDIEGVHNHRRAALNTEPKVLFPLLSKISVPMLVIQAEADPIFPPPHGKAIAQACHGKLLSIKQMGHALNPGFYDVIVKAIVENSKQ